MVMEGKIPDARGRTWNLKTPEAGAFQGWTPSVVPKVNIPASKINHQIIADKYGIDVELIRGKDWVEVLEVIRKLGRYAEGGLAEILQAPRSGYGDGRSVKNFIGPLQEQNVISEGIDTSGWGKSRADLIAESGFQNKGLLDFLSEKSRIGSDNVGLKLSPSAELNLSKSSEGDYNIKNKNIWMGLSSILNLGPFSADIDYGKIKNKIKVKSQKEGATVFKDAGDDEMLAYKLGYAKDGLNMDVRTDKSLNNFLLSLNKEFKRKPKYIFKKAQGGLARILEV